MAEAMAEALAEAMAEAMAKAKAKPNQSLSGLPVPNLTTTKSG